MKSPFPGMDPYIETHRLWGDFHNALIAELHRALGEVLPRGYVARTGERSYIVLAESEEKAERYFEPDVKVTAARQRRTAPARGGGTALVNEPIITRAFIDEQYLESFIDIYELEPERRLVTSIEVLSPSNKKRGSKGWKKYLRKRQALLLARPISSRSTCCAAERACRCSTRSRTALTMCSLPAKSGRQVVAPGRPSLTSRSRLSPSP
jgi:Protein of unknown function (DUF4058)